MPNDFVTVIRKANGQEKSYKAELLGERIVKLISTGQKIHFDMNDGNEYFKTSYEPVGEDGTETVTYYMEI